MRAYKKTTLVDGDGDSWLERHEFPALLPNLLYFTKLFVAFDAVDSGGDRRMDVSEFQAGLEHVGLRLTDADAQAEFQAMDTDGGGQVLFDEFCAWAARRRMPVDGVVMAGYTESSTYMGTASVAGAVEPTEAVGAQ
jgi:hypothetical protein